MAISNQKLVLLFSILVLLISGMLVSSKIAKADWTTDLTGPTTTITATCLGATFLSGGICASAVTFSLSCVDTGASGCLSSFYGLDLSPTTQLSSYTWSYDPNTSFHTFNADSNDNALNVGPTASFPFAFAAPTPTTVPYLQTSGGDVQINQ